MRVPELPLAIHTTIINLFPEGKGATAMNYRREYQSRLRTPEETMHLIEPGDDIVAPTAAGAPPALIAALLDMRTLRQSAFPAAANSFVRQRILGANPGGIAVSQRC